MQRVKEMQRHSLYVISGISGSGKTTLGKLIAKDLDATFIDQDSFYLKSKPMVQLSDGSMRRNWDCLEALDISMKEHVEQLLVKSSVVLVGFALCRDVLSRTPDVHIHLITANDPQNLEDRCKYARIQAKPNLNIGHDELVVKELVIPFYHEMVRNSDITHLVSVFDESGERLSIDTLINIVKSIIQESNKERQTNHLMDVAEPYHSLIRNKVKPVEGRKISSTWRKVRTNDIITMTCSDKVPFDVKVVSVNMYLPSSGDPLTQYLLGETLERTLPGVTCLDEGKRIYLQWSSLEEINKLGMMGITIEVI